MTGAEPHTTNKNNNSLEIRERILMSKVRNLFVRKNAQRWFAYDFHQLMRDKSPGQKLLNTLENIFEFSRFDLSEYISLL